MITNLHLGHKGQLGNQLFQLAALYSLSLHLHEQVLLPISNIYVVAYKNKIYQSSLDLWNCFDLPQSMLTARINIHPTSYYKQPSVSYDPLFWSLQKDVNIDGYFQSEKFFLRYRHEILDLLQFKPEIKRLAEWRMNNIRCHGKEVVGVHVRRRDYVDNQSECKWEYYSRAIEYMISKGKTNFVVVTDDVEWCQEQFQSYKNIHYTEDFGHYVDLCLLTLCDHHILCNSTFGWWGSWLCPNQNRIVVAPEVWCPKTDLLKRFTENYNDSRCEHWTTLL